MKETLKITLCNTNQTPLAWDSNFNNVKNAILDAKKNSSALILFPELSLTSSCCGNFFLYPYIQDFCFGILNQIKALSNDIAIVVGLPLRFNDKIYNTCCVIKDGKILGFIPKTHLSSFQLTNESSFFSKWNHLEGAYIEISGERYLISPDLTFNIHNHNVAIKIGADIQDSQLLSNSVDVILNPSADYFAFEKYHKKQLTLIDISKKLNKTIVYTNALGNESGPVIFDGASLVISKGNILAQNERFSFKDYNLTTYDFSSINTSTSNNCKTKEYSKNEEFALSASLGLFDYQRKSHCKKICLSLSGGADSACCASFVALMTHFGAKELGSNLYLNKLLHTQEQNQNLSEKEIIKRTFTCFYQASQNSSDITFQAAKTLADAIGATFYSLKIDNLIQGYVDLIESTTGEKLSWEKHDQALQNIQARVRLPSAWLITNLNDALLLATGNRSEAIVGYATMDGDTAGALAPLGGIDKTFIREWLIWLEKEGLKDGFKMPALYKVNEQQPTAELRPLGSNQTDEGDLMPYSLLTEIEFLATTKKLSPLQLYQEIKAKHPEYNSDSLKKWTEKFFRLWTRNQWKRNRYALSFHFSDDYLDQVSACSFPSLSGGEKEELKLLAESD